MLICASLYQELIHIDPTKSVLLVKIGRSPREIVRYLQWLPILFGITILYHDTSTIVIYLP